MSLIQDLSIIMNDPVRARSIHRIVSARDRPLQQAYDYLAEVAGKAGLSVVRLSALLLKYDDENRQDSDEEDTPAFLRGNKCRSTREFCATVTAYNQRYRVFTRHELTALASELTLLGLRGAPTNSAAMSFFEEQADRVLEQIAEVDEETVGRYRGLKSHWLNRNIEMKALSANLEARVENAALIRRQFMEIFGHEFRAEREQLLRMKVAERRLQILRENPGINQADLQRMLGHNGNRQDSALSRHQLGRPAGCVIPGSDRTASANGDHSKAKYLLRSLIALIHPDKTDRYELGPNPRSQLDSIWHEVAALRAENSKAALIRAIPWLENQLQLARKVLDLAHLEDIDASLIVQGSTIAEQVAWLESTNELLDDRMRRLQVDSLHYFRNRELGNMQALIAAPQQVQQAERQEMVEKCERFRQRAASLEQRIARLFPACA